MITPNKLYEKLIREYHNTGMFTDSKHDSLVLVSARGLMLKIGKPFSTRAAYTSLVGVPADARDIQTGWRILQVGTKGPMKEQRIGNVGLEGVVSSQEAGGVTLTEDEAHRAIRDRFIGACLLPEEEGRELNNAYKENRLSLEEIATLGNGLAGNYLTRLTARDLR